jgi:hypothetical protein
VLFRTLTVRIALTRRRSTALKKKQRTKEATTRNCGEDIFTQHNTIVAGSDKPPSFSPVSHRSSETVILRD